MEETLSPAFVRFGCEGELRLFVRNFLNDVIASEDQYFERGRWFMDRRRAVIGRRRAPPRGDLASAILRSWERGGSGRPSAARHPRRRRTARRRTTSSPLHGREGTETGGTDGTSRDGSAAAVASMTRDSCTSRAFQAILSSSSSSSLLLSFSRTSGRASIVPGPAVASTTSEQRDWPPSSELRRRRSTCRRRYVGAAIWRTLRNS